MLFTAIACARVRLTCKQEGRHLDGEAVLHIQAVKAYAALAVVALILSGLALVFFRRLKKNAG